MKKMIDKLMIFEYILRKILSELFKKEISMRRSIKIVLGIADLFLLFICMLLAFYSITLPDSYYTHKGSELSLSCYFKVTPDNSDDTMQSSKSESVKLGEKTTLKLFGIIPIKEVYIEENAF